MAGCVSMKPARIAALYTPVPVSAKALDIPVYDVDHQLNGYPYVYWHFCKQKQNQLGLVSPETSTDSLIFRMWMTNPVGRKRQPHGLVEIRKDSDGQWQGQLILMRVDFNLRRMSENITKTRILDLKPLLTNWESVADSLMKLKIDELPTDDQIPDYYLINRDQRTAYGNTSPTFSFEYATPRTYRFFQYNDMDRAADYFWQPRHVIIILDLLEDEFQWDSIGRWQFSRN